MRDDRSATLDKNVHFLAPLRTSAFLKNTTEYRLHQLRAHQISTATDKIFS